MSAPIVGKDPVFWDVGGIPVACLPKPEGGSRTLAFDVPNGRPVSRAWARDEGVEIDEAAFTRLLASAQGAA